MQHDAGVGGNAALFVGIDSAAKTVTARWLVAGGRATRPQTAEGFAAVRARGRRGGRRNERDAGRHGSYWMALARAGCAVSMITPKRAHDFAKALLKRAKTDAVDAATLAELGTLLRPARWTPPRPVYTELAQRLAGGVVCVREQVRNPHPALLQRPVMIASVRTGQEELIATLDAQIAAVEAKLEVALSQDETWAAAAERLRGIKGIGLCTTVCLLVTALNITATSRPDAATGYAV